MSPAAPKPWYRHVWPWLLIIPPLGAVFFAGEGEWQEEEKTNEPPEV